MFSNSRLNCLLNCEQKYIYKYVLRTPEDEGFVKSNALTFGTAFHKLLELCKYEYSNYKKSILENICKEFNYNYDIEGAKFACMIREYFKNVDMSLIFVATEVHFETEQLQGFIDLVYKDKDDNWYMADLKTVGFMDKILPNKLHVNQQIGIYTYFHKEIAEKLNLDPKKFKGFKYQEVQKPLQRYKQGETFEEYTLRCTSKYRETYLPKENIKYLETMLNIVNVINKASLITETNATKNFQSCLQFGSPCPYWSKCYGNNFVSTEEIIENNLMF